MSAFIVSDKQISEVLNYINCLNQYDKSDFNFMPYNFLKECEKNNESLTRREALIACGEMILKENHKSVMYRYPDRKDQTFSFFDYTEKTKCIGYFQFIKFIDCIEYQSCEHENWESSNACKILKSFKQYATSKQKDYEIAHWAI